MTQPLQLLRLLCLLASLIVGIGCRVPLEPDEHSREAVRPPPNVLWIVVDTLRADRFSPQIMPKLYRWFQTRGTRFENAFSTAPWTLPAHISMFTGMDSLSHGLNYGGTLGPEHLTVAQRFRERGFDTLAVTGGGYLDSATGLDSGFERFENWRGALGASGELEQGIETLTSWLETERSFPFFALLHTYETHTPFEPREPWFTQYAGSTNEDWRVVGKLQADEAERQSKLQDIRRYGIRDGDTLHPLDGPGRELLAALYDSGVSYADQEIALMLGRLERAGALENTIVLLTSDHGEALGERGLALHTHLYDFNLAVPLAIAVPGSDDPPERLEAAVSIIDLPATLVELSLGEGWQQGEGRSLVPLLHGQRESRRTLWSFAGSTNLGLALHLEGRFKIILADSVAGTSRGEVEAYDLRLDPEESSPLDPQQIPSSLFERLLSHTRSATGRHLEFENRSPVSVTLTIQPASIQYIKVVDLPAAIETHHTLDSLRLDIPPFFGFGLRLDGPLSTQEIYLDLEFAAQDCRLTPSASSEYHWIFDTSRTPCAGGEALEGSQLTLKRIGSATPHQPIELDVELRSRLEALGYLE